MNQEPETPNHVARRVRVIVEYEDLDTGAVDAVTVLDRKIRDGDAFSMNQSKRINFLDDKPYEDSFEFAIAHSYPSRPAGRDRVHPGDTGPSTSDIEPDQPGGHP
jgi:hypothetical protein